MAHDEFGGQDDGGGAVPVDLGEEQRDAAGSLGGQTAGVGVDPVAGLLDRGLDGRRCVVTDQRPPFSTRETVP
jgi:hypothetical protein